MNLDAGQAANGEPSEPNRSGQSPLQRILFGDAGLRPGWLLLLYVVILAAPLGLLLLAARLVVPAKAPAAPEAHAVMPAPLLLSMAGEWFNFGYVLFATWIMSRIENRSLLDFGLRSCRKARQSTLGAVSGLLGMGVLILALLRTHRLAIDGLSLHGPRAWGYGLGWAFMFIGVGFFEEFFFRGYLQAALARCFASLYSTVAKRGAHRDAFGFWAAAVVISFGFGLVHRSNPGESPIGLLSAGLAGMVFAYSLWRTGSLWWAIGFHAAWDWAQSFVFGVADSGTLIRQHLLSSHPAGTPLLSGGLTGPEGSVFVLPVLLLIPVVVATTLPNCRSSSGSVERSSLPPQQVNLPGA